MGSPPSFHPPPLPPPFPLILDAILFKKALQSKSSMSELAAHIIIELPLLFDPSRPITLFLFLRSSHKFFNWEELISLPKKETNLMSLIISQLDKTSSAKLFVASLS